MIIVGKHTFTVAGRTGRPKVSHPENNPVEEQISRPSVTILYPHPDVASD